MVARNGQAQGLPSSKGGSSKPSSPSSNGTRSSPEDSPIGGTGVFAADFLHQPREPGQLRQEFKRMTPDGIDVARYAQVPQFDASILDTHIPRCRRLTQLHFGHIVSNPHAPMAFKEKMGYNMTFNLVTPQCGNALHMHKSVEIFIALDGRWEIAWGMHGEHTTVLQPWDLVCVPARVCHSYKNIEKNTAHNIMTILPGKSWIAWAPSVVAEARANGAECDDNGMLLKYAHLMADTDYAKSLASCSESVEWKHLGKDEMAPYVRSFADGRPLEVEMDIVQEDGTKPSIELFWKTVDGETSWELPRKAGADILLVVLEGNILVRSKDSSGSKSVVAAGRLDAIKVPHTSIEAGKVTLHNPCPTECTLLVSASLMRAYNDQFFHLC